MITEKELRIVDELRSDRAKLEQLLRSFSCQYVHSKMGIVSINSASKNDPDISEHAKFFHTRMRSLVSDLSDQTIAALEHELKCVNVEISKYIKEDG